MNRRSFILNSAGLLVPFTGCSRKKKKKTVIGPDEYEEPEEPESFEEVPYYEAKYSTGESVSDSDGVAEIYTNKGLHEVKLVDDRNQSVGGLEVVLHEESKYGSNAFYVIDEDREYMPNLFVPRIGKKAGLDLIKMYARKLFDRGKEIIVNKLDISNRIENSIPSHNPDRIDNVPGFVYMGDWSFNNLKEMNGVLQDGSAVISVLAPNPVSSAAFGVLSKSGAVLEGIDTAIDWINDLSDFKIDKDREFPIYKPTLNTNNLTHLIFSFRDVKKNETYDIRELLQLQPGNWWWYSFGEHEKGYAFGYYRWDVEDIKKINGKEYIPLNKYDIFYYGFKGNSLYLCGIGDINQERDYILETPIKIGDNKIKVGDIYENETKIIGPYGSGYKFNLEYLLHVKVNWMEKEDVVVWGVPYGNCIKAKIEYNIKDDNLKPRHVDSFNYKWYAKNMGMVKGIILKEDNLSDIKDSNNRLLFNYKLNSS